MPFVSKFIQKEGVFFPRWAMLIFVLIHTYVSTTVVPVLDTLVERSVTDRPPATGD